MKLEPRNTCEFESKYDYLPYILFMLLLLLTGILLVMGLEGDKRTLWNSLAAFSGVSAFLANMIGFALADKTRERYEEWLMGLSRDQLVSLSRAEELDNESRKIVIQMLNEKHRGWSIS